MRVIEIKQEKQSNGLWGTPLNCMRISGIPILDDHKLLFWSAIICSISERVNKKFEVSDFFGKGIFVRIWSDGPADSTYVMYYDKYEVIDDTLYEFADAQERLSFIRKHKILKLNEK